MNKPFNPATLEGQYYNALYALIEKKSPKIASSVIDELNNQRSSLKLIASENYSSLSVQAAMGTLLTDKYAEGFPYHLSMLLSVL